MKKIILLIVITLFLTGCNKQIVDFNYSYNKAICKIGDEVKKIKLKSWKDYNGEQLQLKDYEGNTYLVSSINCTLIGE